MEGIGTTFEVLTRYSFKVSKSYISQDVFAKLK